MIPIKTRVKSDTFKNGAVGVNTKFVITNTLIGKN